MASGSGAIRAGRAYVELFADDSRLVRGLRASQARLKAWGASIASAGMKMMAAGGAIVAPILAAAHNFASTGAELYDMSKRTGMAVEALSVLGYAAKHAGSDLGSVERAVRIMQKSIAGAADSVEGTSGKLDHLGLTARDLAGKGTAEQFNIISQRIAAIEDPTMRAAAALQVFGRTGTSMLPMIEELAKLTKEAKEFGLIRSSESVKRAKELDDAFTLMGAVAKSVWNAVGDAIAPVLMEAIAWINRALVSIRAWINEHRGAVVSALKFGAAVMAAGAALVGVGYLLKGAALAFGVLRIAASIAHVAIMLVNGALIFLSSPIGVALVAVGLLTAAWLKWTEIGRSVAQSLSDAFAGLKADVETAVSGISDALAAGDIGLAAEVLWATLQLIWAKGIRYITNLWYDLEAGAVEVWASMRSAWADICEVLAALAYSAVGLIQIAWARLGAWLSEGWSLLKSGWEGVCNFFGNAWASVVAGAQKVWAYFTAGLEKAWNILQKIAHPIDFNLEEANKQVDEQLAKRLAEIEAQKTAKIDTGKQAKDTRLEELRKQREATEQEYKDRKAKIAQEVRDGIKGAEDVNAARQKLIDQERQAQHTANEKARQESIDEAQKNVDAATKARDDAVKKAADAAKKAKEKAKPELDKKGVSAALDIEQGKVSTVGTFNPNALYGLGSAVLMRIARATEETAKNTARKPAAPAFTK